MFIFNGDVDMACNYLGDEQFVDSLTFQVGTLDIYPHMFRTMY